MVNVATLVATAAMTNAGNGHHLPALSTESISSMVGWISIWVWVVLLTHFQLIPSISQLQENYQLKSGEGLSIIFVAIWLAGDALNMIGAWIEGLLPTMIILAGYYCLCDVALIWQYYYYRKYHDYFHPTARPASINANPAASESTPLLNGNGNTTATVTIREKPRSPTLGEEIAKCFAGLAFTTIAGIISWYITAIVGWPGQSSFSALEQKGWRWDGQIAGWASALLYLSSRIPQIFKNRETKCEGLSLALFVFAVVGNVTYVASILIKDLSRDYVIENLSWLIGSSGTVFLDFVVLGQFIVYREERERLVREREANESSFITA